MIRYRVLQLLFLVSSTMSGIKGMLPEKVSSMPSPVQEIIEGIAQKIEELPKELKYKILSSALNLRENQKYEVYKKFDVDYKLKGIVLNTDSTRALTGSNNGRIRLWDIEGARVIKKLKDHDTSIYLVALSTDGSLALTLSWNGTARVWDVLTEELLNTFQVGSTLHSIVLSANGTLALTGGVDSIARLYNTSTGELIKELEGHTDDISSVSLSADGTLALTGSRDETARVWNILTGKSIILQTGSWVNSVALSSDGTITLTATTNSKVLVWNARSGTLLNTLLMSGFDCVNSVALNNEGKRALVGTHDKKIQIWNTQPLPGKKETTTPLTVLEGHTGQVTVLAFGSADFIASGSLDQTVLIWKPFTLKDHYWPLKQGKLDWEAFTEQEKVIWQAYKETFSRLLLRSAN